MERSWLSKDCASATADADSAYGDYITHWLEEEWTCILLSSRASPSLIPTSTTGKSISNMICFSFAKFLRRFFIFTAVTSTSNVRAWFIRDLDSPLLSWLCFRRYGCLAILFGPVLELVLASRGFVCQVGSGDIDFEGKYKAYVHLLEACLIVILIIMSYFPSNWTIFILFHCCFQHPEACSTVSFNLNGWRKRKHNTSPSV